MHTASVALGGVEKTVLRPSPQEVREVLSKFVEEGSSLHEELARIGHENAQGSWVSGFWECSNCFSLTLFLY